jgi:hypothetical protein
MRGNLVALRGQGCYARTDGSARISYSEFAIRHTR